MKPDSLIERLLAQPDPTGQRELLCAAVEELGDKESDELAEALMEQVIRLQNVDTQVAMKAAEMLLNLAEITQKPRHRAMGLKAKAQTLVIGQGEYQQALPLYEEALETYRDLDDEVSQSRVQVTRIWALASLGKYEQAIRDGEQAREAFIVNYQWRELASLNNNLALIYRHAGDSARALAMLDATREAYRNLGSEGERYLANVELNRALALYELGELEASLQASQTALELAGKFNQTAVTAIVQHNLGMTYFRLGRPNQALQMFDQASVTYLKEGQQHNAALCELASMDCLLEIGRYGEVLEKCQATLETFSTLGMLREVAEVKRIQALTFTKIHHYSAALNALAEARKIFQDLGNEQQSAITELAIITAHLMQAQYAECLAEARECVDRFEALGLPFERAQAQILAARAAIATGQTEFAEENARSVLAFGEEHDLTLLLYESHHIMGELAWKDKSLHEAQNHYYQAVEALQRLRGKVMVEHRAGFLMEKEKVYEEIVALNVELGQVERALNYTEQAKSRGLLDILAHRLDLGIHAHTPSDHSLVEEIFKLRRDREQLLFRSAGRLKDRGEEKREDQLQTQKQLRKIEDRITNLWHTLLVRDADYAREADLWGVIPEVKFPSLPAGTLVIEYFAIAGKLVVFLVSGGGGNNGSEIRFVPLPASIAQTQSLLQRLGLNLRLAPAMTDIRLAELTANAQGILQQLHGALLEPLSAELSAHPKLIIVPHGPLHYLPFHALYDSHHYLVEDHEITYLPAISFFEYICPGSATGEGALAVGYSHQGELPQAVLEADLVAELFGGDTLLESNANLARLLELAPTARLLHFACHGDFRPDKPLFSGLELADGWLTTLDIFNMHLQASLVTLSACQTGRNVVGGGDELQGLMRAFLAAGAVSLVLSHWPVEDRSTARLMEHFYQRLIEGIPKGEALRAAQLSLLYNDERRYHHPYYWAPFHLIGDSGQL